MCRSSRQGRSPCLRYFEVGEYGLPSDGYFARTHKMTIDVSIENGELSICGCSVVLPGNAEHFIVCDDVVVVLLAPKHDRTGGRNVFGVTPSGKVMWQIEAADSALVKKNVYVNIGLDGKGMLIAGTFSGIEYVVDAKNGSAQLYQFSRL